jgi:hypothetical protein
MRKIFLLFCLVSPGLSADSKISQGISAAPEVVRQAFAALLEQE